MLPAAASSRHLLLMPPAAFISRRLWLSSSHLHLMPQSASLPLAAISSRRSLMTPATTSLLPPLAATPPTSRRTLAALPRGIGKSASLPPSPQLNSLLKEMKDGLDTMRSKVLALTQKMKQNQLPIIEGMSYLEAKHLLLLSYCQSIVYYTLRNAKGLSIKGQLIVRSLIENRLFLEKIEYQVHKLIRASSSASVERKVGGDKEQKEVKA